MIDFPHKEKYDAQDLRQIVEILRGEGGCPWDREQTHATLRRNLLEETAELCEAIDREDPALMREELGDVWLQVLFHASIEQERGSFDLDDVADAECKKLISRHPHVFGDVTVSDVGEELSLWEDLKRAEKRQATAAEAMDADVRGLIRGTLSAMALRRIRERVAHFAPLVGRQPGRITIREQKTRWGSCSGKGNLNFNWKLIMAPPQVLDYVVIHELCHLYEFNHSPRFWALVAAQMPDYEIWKKWLKNHRDDLYL